MINSYLIQGLANGHRQSAKACPGRWSTSCARYPQQGQTLGRDAGVDAFESPASVLFQPSWNLRVSKMDSVHCLMPPNFPNLGCASLRSAGPRNVETPSSSRSVAVLGGRPLHQVLDDGCEFGQFGVVHNPQFHRRQLTVVGAAFLLFGARNFFIYSGLVVNTMPVS